MSKEGEGEDFHDKTIVIEVQRQTKNQRDTGE
jgi:hypothetical protein